MGSISTIVNVQISRQTSVPTRTGFGTGAFVSADATFAERVKTYSSFAEVSDDTTAGADSTAASLSYFGQQLSPTKISIIRQAQNVNQVDQAVFDAPFVTGNSISVNVDAGTPVVVPFNTDNDTTLADVAAAIQSFTEVTTAVDTPTDTIDVTYSDFLSHALTLDVTLGASQPTATITIVTAASVEETFTEALNAAVDYNNDWYGLGIYSREVGDIEEVSDWIQGQGNNNPKLYFAQSEQDSILTVVDTDIASVLQAKANFRTSVWYHAINSEYLEMGLMGGQLPTDPGSITWAYKQASTITVDSMTDSEKQNAHNKAANTYTEVASVNITEEGKVSDSPFEWIDVIRGVDWLQTNLSADLYELLLQNPKLPYDTGGINQVKAVTLNRLKLAQDQGVLSTDVQPIVTVPDISDVSASDKANRVLNDVKFTGVLAGAIQKINVQGTVTLI